MVVSSNSVMQRGRTEPRIYTPPLAVGPAGPCGCGCALTEATSKGFEAVSFAETVVGLKLFPYQRWLLIHALELIDGRFRYRTVLMMVARQNGKTTLVEIKNLWKLYLPGVPLVIGTAQNLDIAEESWDKALEIIEGVPDLAAELESVSKVNGKKQFRLKNGARWKVTTANRRGGRGLSGDDVNLDELREHQSWQAWGAITKTMMARRDAQTWAFSNAGDDKSIVLNDLQRRGRAAADGLRSTAVADPDVDVDTSLGHFEWSGPDDTKCTCRRLTGDSHGRKCDIIRPDILAQANPSMEWPGGVLYSALVSAANTDPDEIFLTECLCVHVPDLAGQSIDAGVWAKLGNAGSKRAGSAALAVRISPDRKRAAVALYAHDVDGIGHMKLARYDEGTDWIVDYLDRARDALAENLLAIGMSRGTYASLREQLTEAGFKLPEAKAAPQPGDLCVLAGPDLAAACGQLIDAVRQKSFLHIPEESLTISVKAARTRLVGDVLTWGRTSQGGADISPLDGVTEARWTFYHRIGIMQSDDYDPVEDIA